MKVLFSLPLVLAFTLSTPDGRAAQGLPPCPHLPVGAVHWTTYFAGTNTARYDPNTDVATILPGKIVYLNETPRFDISLLIVKGSLVFDHCFDNMELVASSILVISDGTAGNGVLQIGKSNLRFPYTATIKLRTWPDPNSIPSAAWSGYDTEIQGALADRGLVVCNGGTLRIYGADRGESWTKLALTAGVGATSLTTMATVLPWAAADEVVIASTDFEQAQAETRTLKTPTAGGQLEFQTGLSHQHWGTVQNFDPGLNGDLAWSVDERAEVGLLNRNVRILGEQSTYSSADPENFGHVFIYRGASAALPRVEISWAEFRDLGIAGKPARYPVHFHMLQDPGSLENFIEYSSIRSGHNRGLVIHDSEAIRAQGNVVFDVVGYGIYVEDLDTINCDILDNLSLSNRKLEPTGPSPLIDKDPSNFALRSLSNNVQGNVAAGSKAYGIYFDLYNGAFTPAGMTFAGNSAHSCQITGIYENHELEPSALITFSDSRVWKCREYGMWIRCLRDYVVDGLVAADCRSGFYPASKGLREAGEGHQLLTNGLFVGETDNLGEPVTTMEQGEGRSLPQLDDYLYSGEPNAHELKWDTLNGVEMYDGFIEIENSRFAEFKDRDLGSYGSRLAAGLTQVAKISNWINDPRNRVSDLLFDPNSVDRTAHFRDTANGHNQIAFTTIVDEDDSLGHGAGVVLMPDTSLLTDFGPAAFDTGLNGWIAPLSAASYGQVSVRLNTGPPLDSLLAWTGWRRVQDPGGATPALGTIWHAETVPTDPLDGGENAYVFPVCVEVGDWALAASQVRYYRMAYDPSYGTSSFPVDLSIAYRFADDVDKVVFLELPYDRSTGPAAVTYRDADNAQLGVAQVGSLAALLDQNLSYGQAWYWSGTTLHLKLTSQVKTGQTAGVFGTQLKMEIDG